MNKTRETHYRDALAHIVEYWNRDRNEDAMHDALWHIIETAAQALEAVPSQAAESVGWIQKGLGGAEFFGLDDALAKLPHGNHNLYAASQAAEPISVTDETLRELYARARTQANVQDFIGGAYLYLASFGREQKWRGGDVAAGTFVMQDGRWTEVSKDVSGSVVLFHQEGWLQEEQPIKCTCMKCGKLPEELSDASCKEGFCPLSPIAAKEPK